MSIYLSSFGVGRELIMQIQVILGIDNQRILMPELPDNIHCLALLLFVEIPEDAHQHPDTQLALQYRILYILFVVVCAFYEAANHC